MKIKHVDGFEQNGVRALQKCVQVDHGYNFFGVQTC